MIIDNTSMEAVLPPSRMVFFFRQPTAGMLRGAVRWSTDTVSQFDHIEILYFSSAGMLRRAVRQCSQPKAGDRRDEAYCLEQRRTC